MGTDVLVDSRLTAGYRGDDFNLIVFVQDVFRMASSWAQIAN
jgi:hypothetical protein